MKKLKIINEYLKDINGKDLQFDKIIKTQNSIICLVNNQIHFEFIGVNFNNFTLDEGIEWDKDIEEVKNKTLAQLTLENANLKQQVEMLSKTVASM